MAKSTEDAARIIQERLDRYLIELSGIPDGMAFRTGVVEQTQAALACYMLNKQASVLDGMKEQQEEAAALYHETHSAVIEMRKDSRAIKWLTIVLVLVTILLGFFASKLDSAVDELGKVAKECRANSGNPSTVPNRQ